MKYESGYIQTVTGEFGRVIHLGKTFIIIPGVQKCGTTTLFDMLSCHPEIDVPRTNKEPQFFCLGKSYVENNIDWYFKLFGNDKRFNLDASTIYLTDSQAPYLLKEYLHQVKVIIILRDPVKRLYSNYLYMKSKAPKYELRTFNSILESITGPDVETIIRTENKHLENSLREGHIKDDYFGAKHPISQRYNCCFSEVIEDKLWMYRYFQRSIYSLYTPVYEKLFGSDVHLMFFEELISNPQAQINQLFDFLGLNSYSQCELLPHSNQTKVVKNETIYYFSKSRLGKFLINLARSNRIWESINLKGWLYETPPPISKEQYLKARAILRMEYEYWLQKNEKLQNWWTY